MKVKIPGVFVLIMVSVFSACTSGGRLSRWNEGAPVYEVQEIFTDGRFPNVVVTTDGTLVAVWGSNDLRVRLSEDGGRTWGMEILVAVKGIHGGGAIVDESSGDILIFAEEQHPPAPVTLFRSSDNGQTWTSGKPIIKPNSHGHVPSMHMNEHGISLSKGKYKGRIIRPSRYYGSGNGREFWTEHYTNAIYSDDGGKSWQTSEPFPAMGTGEAAIVELDDGTLYYNSRRHKSTDGMDPRRRYVARSYDGGHTWEDLTLCRELPDGAQHTDYGLMAGLARLPVNGHDIMLFSNIDVPAEKKDEDVPFELLTSRRFSGTVWASFDGGETWPVKKVADTGSFAYSSLAAGRPGTPSEGFIYLFYESAGGGKIARFNLPWLVLDALVE